MKYENGVKNKGRAGSCEIYIKKRINNSFSNIVGINLDIENTKSQIEYVK